MKKTVSTLFVISALIIAVLGLYWITSKIWGHFKLLDPTVSVAILTAATTVFVATLTVVLGKYYERKKDIEALYREKKTEIYDEFLCEFFKLFHAGDKDNDAGTTGMVDFLRQWQRKMILWGGQDVLKKYIDWIGHLKKGSPDAQAMFMMEEFFLEIRKDLGHKNNKLVKGTFISLILQNPELFLILSEKNPKLTLQELAEAEKALQGLQTA